MRLKSLRLFGFKTFADQTVLGFEPGITALVGPNGSGKSNLVDAIRWALGEHHPRSLRTTKTEDVIFAGNERRKPVGMTEVSVTFDNEEGVLPIDFREVQITRRAYRAGESEYYINRTQVRLRDVVELLMGTGLGPGSTAIVSQGQIDAFLSEKPTERRSLFEETAGINKFLARKAESLRRLEQTEQNGIRISDLLAEITARIPELETQVRRAKRYRRVATRLRDLEILTYLRSTASRRQERERVEAQFADREARRAAAAARSAALEAELTTLRTELYARELDLEQKRADATAARAELADLESQYAAWSARRDALATQASGISGERDRVASERVALERSLEGLEARIAPQQVELDAQRAIEQQAREAVAVARADLDHLYEQLRDVEAAVAAGTASEAERRATVQALHAEEARLADEAQRAHEDSAASLAEAERRSAALRDAEAAGRQLEKRALEAEQRLASHEARLAAASDRVAAAQTALRDAARDAAATEARLHAIEELEANLEGHAAGTRAMLEAHARGQHPGIVDVVANLIRVDERYARALDIAFGPSLSNIVTKTADDAERAIAFLRDKEVGRATFLPLDVLATRQGRDPASAPERPGVIGYAHGLVHSAPEYAGIVAFLVGRILVVETLRVGIELLRRDGFRDGVVTLDGDQISSGGAMTGGRYKRERAILSRRAQAETLRSQLPELRRRLETAEATLAAHTADHEAALRERDDARTVLNDATLALRDARSAQTSLNRDAERLRAEAQNADARAKRFQAERASVAGRVAALELQRNDPSALEAQRRGLEESFEQARRHIAAAQEQERAVSSAVAAVRAAAGALIAERDGARARLSFLDADRERATQARAQIASELDQLERRIRGVETALGEARARVHAVDAATERARSDRDAIMTRAGELELQVRQVQAEERAGAAQADGARLRLAEIEAELGMLASAFAQNPATQEECADVERRYAGDESDFTGDVARLREELARLSSVNLNAEEERDALAQRENYLREQLDDLAKARETLLTSIAEIEASSQIQFNETFALVQRSFHDVFPRLFPGGEARMWQTHPESLSETGIEISVQPPGKKMTALQALSGGERAMTAAALIFALIRVRPSPFYLLDEVDAALDDANIERFSAVVRELANAAQLVLVTHNKKTMELAHRLVGVTMAEPGVSSIVAADLDRAQVEAPPLAG